MYDNSTAQVRHLLTLNSLVEIAKNLSCYTDNEELFSSLYEVLTIFGSKKNLTPEDLIGFTNLTQQLNNTLINGKNLVVLSAVANAYFEVYSEEDNHSVFLECQSLTALQVSFFFF